MAAQLDYLDHLRRESARFRAVLAETDPGGRVPSCPDWEAADLLWHLAEVQLFWGRIVRDRLDDPGAADEPQRPAGFPALLALFDDASAALTDALANTADGVHVWTWHEPDQTVGFVRRRQAHEALIHRLDAELTAGTLSDMDADLATDGVAEVLHWMYGGVPKWATPGADGPIGRVATTDTASSWLVRIGSWSGTSPNTGNSYSDEPNLTLVSEGAPSFTVSGTARDLDAWLWNRPTRTDVTLEGDYARFEEIIRAGVQ